MDSLASPGSSAVLPKRSMDFLERTARSIAEVQPGLDTIPEVVVFLEVLGYTTRDAVQNGFKDLFDVAERIYPLLDHYIDRQETMHNQQENLLLPVPSMVLRLARGIGLVFPWLSSLVVLLFFGVSLWLVFGLPLSITTSLIVGLFFGLLVSEGPVQLFQRVYSFYFDQYNLSEVRRAIRRSAYLTVGLVALADASIYGVTWITHIPFELTVIAMVAASSILLHRVSYVLVYSLKRFGEIVASYAVALATLILVYSYTYNLIPLTLDRYLTSLGVAIVVLSVLPLYYGYRVFTAKTAGSLSQTKANPLNTMKVNKRTIMSNFRIQFWEAFPYYLFGMLFFAMLFGDRVMSWFFNPNHVANGIQLPLVFNSTYHLGADVALLVIFPAAIAQYAIMSPVSEQLNNLVTKTSVGDIGAVDRFLRHRYALTVSISAAVAAVVAFFLFVFSWNIEAIIGGTSTSVFVLQMASVSNIFMVIFMANCLFLIFMNKIKALVGVTAAALLILTQAGFILARWGYQDLAYAYLIAAIVAMVISYQFVVWTLDRPGSLFFSRYI